MGTRTYTIGIAGGTGAGKTAVAEEIADAAGSAVTVIPVDNYYEDLTHLSFEERTERNYDHPSAFEWDLLVDHLRTLTDGESIEMPQYDFSRHNRKDETVTVEPSTVVILEGIFALFDERVRELLDLHVYVQTDADVRILRRIERDVLERGRDIESVRDQYLSTVKPMHEGFVEPTKKHADVIIPEGVNVRAVDLLVEKVQSKLPGQIDEMSPPTE